MVDAESLSFICPTRLNKARRLRPFAAHRINLQNADKTDFRFLRFAYAAYVCGRGTIVVATQHMSSIRSFIGFDLAGTETVHSLYLVRINKTRDKPALCSGG